MSWRRRTRIHVGGSKYPVDPEVMALAATRAFALSYSEVKQLSMNPHLLIIKSTHSCVRQPVIRLHTLVHVLNNAAGSAKVCHPDRLVQPLQDYTAMRHASCKRCACLEQSILRVFLSGSIVLHTSRSAVSLDPIKSIRSQRPTHRVHSLATASDARRATQSACLYRRRYMFSHCSQNDPRTDARSPPPSSRCVTAQATHSPAILLSPSHRHPPQSNLPMISPPHCPHMSDVGGAPP